MDSNVEFELMKKGLRVAAEAFAFGDRDRAGKILSMARCIDPDLFNYDLTAETAAAAITETASAWEKIGLVRKINENKEDYYGILGLKKNCSAGEVRKAYRNLLLKVHPDKNNAAGAEEAFKVISKAFKCLSGEESRKEYDRRGEEGEFDGGGYYSDGESFEPEDYVRRRKTRDVDYSLTLVCCFFVVAVVWVRRTW
ncbi:Chaperone protein dnaJ 49 [Linum perenne]